MKVSVAIFTYNHGRFIAKALDSVLMQRTDFDFEVVVGDDCSNDHTQAILQEYRDRHPGVLRLLLNEQNLGAHRNIERTIQSCRGEYVAVLDGDDYWTSPDKLQRQADFLDRLPECMECFHDALIVHEDGSREPTSYRPSQKKFSTVEDLLLDNFIPTSAVMFRRYLFDSLPDWIGRLKMGDWPSHILNARQGQIGYIDETMGVYVVHHGGAWSTKAWEEHTLAIIELFEALRTHLDHRYTRIVDMILRWRYFWAADRYEQMGNVPAARALAVKSLGKHLLIKAGPIVSALRWEAQSHYRLPDDILAVGGKELRRSLLRLCAAPLLQAHAPSLYRVLKAGARKLNLSL